MSETLKLHISFGGGAELLFDKVKKRDVELPPVNKYFPDSIKENWTIKDLLVWIKDNLLRERPELFLQGIRAVIAESFERIHRSNLVGMGIVPLEFMSGENADSLGLNGTELYDIGVPEDVRTGQILTVKVDNSKSFQVKVRFDTEVDLTYFRNGGILNYMIRKML